jgi:hypothetical protein
MLSIFDRKRTTALPTSYSFEIATKEQVFFMYAATEKEKDEWIGAVGRYSDFNFLMLVPRLTHSLRAQGYCQVIRFILPRRRRSKRLIDRYVDETEAALRAYVHPPPAFFIIPPVPPGVPLVVSSSPQICSY